MANYAWQEQPGDWQRMYNVIVRLFRGLTEYAASRSIQRLGTLDGTV